MVNQIEEKEHARLSPSASGRWMSCTGSTLFIEQLRVQDSPSPYAAEGTVAHEVHEKVLLGKGSTAYDFVGKTFTADNMKFTVTEEMASAVQVSIDWIDNLIGEYDWNGFTHNLQVEVRSSLEYLGLKGLDGGTSDTVIEFYQEGILYDLYVHDYKHGQGVAVEADNNTQAMCYALGVCRLHDAHKDTRVTIVIAQPRAPHSEGTIRTWSTTAGELYAWEKNELVPAAKANFDGTGEFVPSEKACRFCLAKGNCQALLKQTQEVAMLDFEEVSETLPSVEVLTTEQKIRIMEHADMIRSFIVGVENQIKIDMDKGSKEYENHFKLVRKTTHRKFTEEALDEVMSPLLDYIQVEDIYSSKPRSLGEIEAALKRELGGKLSAEVMKQVTEKPEGSLVVAPLSDKRKAETPTVINDFTDLD